jgi:hypothetical protein
LLAETSSNGRENDPMIGADAVRATIKLADEDIAEAVHELERDGLVHRHQSLGMGAIGFHALAPRDGFFHVFDPALGIGDPVADARLVAAALIDGGEQAGDVAELAQKLGWTARRMNPALAVLISKNLVMASRALDQVWATAWTRRQPGLRNFSQRV